MSDEKLSADIHAAAKLLCKALNAAGEVGLELDVSFKPYSSAHQGTRLLQTGCWHPHISVCRKTYLD